MLNPIKEPWKHHSIPVNHHSTTSFSLRFSPSFRCWNSLLISAGAAQQIPPCRAGTQRWCGAGSTWAEAMGWHLVLLGKSSIDYSYFINLKHFLINFNPVLVHFYSFFKSSFAHVSQFRKVRSNEPRSWWWNPYIFCWRVFGEHPSNSLCKISM